VFFLRSLAATGLAPEGEHFPKFNRGNFSDFLASYVLSLLTRAQQLRAARKTGVAAIPSNPTPHGQTIPTIAAGQESRSASATLIPQAQTYDEHFMLCTTTESTSRFFGCSSVVVLTVGLASRTFNDPFIFQSQSGPLKTHTANNEVSINNPTVVAKMRIVIPSREMLVTLIGHYMTSLNELYPFIDNSTLDADLEVYLENQGTQSSGTGTLPIKQAYQCFRIAMICAFACANKSRYMSHLVASDEEFFESGLTHVQAVTSEVSRESLQALLLLVLYCLFHPRKGDIWKLLDYACRLSVELGYHTEPSSDQECSSNMSLRKNTFWSLYTIKQIVAQIFGRPCDLPGHIISTDYPGILISGMSPIDQAPMQRYSTAHRYRIFYLRSEIYRELFLPTNCSVPELDWFVKQYFTLSQWYEEVQQVDEAAADIETLTCDVASHSTVIFLFQPLIVRALLDTKEATLDPAARRNIPSENYRSACQLIRTYQSIVRARHDSALGQCGG
jgi:Fungal specific transcription factor domain